MVARVSDLLATNSLIDQINRQRLGLEQTRQEIATGLRVAQPGDDPSTAGTIAQFSSTLTRLENHQSRIGYADMLLSHQENALNGGVNLLIRAKEVAQQAANETLDPEARRALSAEIFEIRDAMVGFANTQFQGRYIYGGTDDDDPPWDKATGVVAPNQPYVEPATAPVDDPRRVHWIFDDTTVEFGQLQTRSVQVSDDDIVRVTSEGDMWREGIETLERLGRSLAGYRTNPEDYTTSPDGTGLAYANTPAAFHDQTTNILNAIDHLDSARVTLQRELGDVGGRSARLEQAKGIVEGIKSETEKARSALQDSDVIAATANFTNLQNSLQSLLATGARINNLSLLDFL